MWEFCKISMHVAQKDYPCDAADTIANASLPDAEFDPDDLKIMQAARAEGNKILKGTKYIKCKGVWEGQWAVFRARPDLNQICFDYGLYPDE